MGKYIKFAGEYGKSFFDSKWMPELMSNAPGSLFGGMMNTKTKEAFKIKE